MQIRILSAADVRLALPMDKAIEAMKRAFSQLSHNKANVPLRTSLETTKGRVLFMPAFMKESNELGFKLVSLWPDNPTQGLPAVIATAMVIDAETGQPVALLNGEELTAIRTGAGGGLAADLLARADASVVAVFGAGVQARAQLEAVCEVRDIQEVRIVGRSTERAELFAQHVHAFSKPPKVQLLTDRITAIKNADIIITATSSETPVFDGKYLSEGTHITAVGSYRPDMQEVDTTTIQQAKIVVDSLPACLAEAGDLLIPLDKNIISKLDIHAELGEIVNGERPGRESAEEITYFKSVGVAVQDAVAANAVYQVAQQRGLGQVVEF